MDKQQAITAKGDSGKDENLVGVATASTGVSPGRPSPLVEDDDMSAPGLAPAKEMVTNPLCWFPWFPKDWITSDAVGRMTDPQVVAYFYLLNRQWLCQDGMLPDDLAILSKYAAHDMTSKEMAPVLDRFPTVAEGCRANRRLYSIYTEQKAKHTKRVQAGKRARSNATLNAGADAPPIAGSTIASVSASGSVSASSSGSVSSREEFLECLRKSYTWLNVDQELIKAQTWCRNKGKTLSKNRLINWLNRAETPVSPATARPTPASRPSAATERTMAQVDAAKELDALRSQNAASEDFQRLYAKWRQTWEPGFIDEVKQMANATADRLAAKEKK